MPHTWTKGSLNPDTCCFPASHLEREAAQAPQDATAAREHEKEGVEDEDEQEDDGVQRTHKGVGPACEVHLQPVAKAEGGGRGGEGMSVVVPSVM
jgi:hypothetical protein